MRWPASTLLLMLRTMTLRVGLGVGVDVVLHQVAALHVAHREHRVGQALRLLELEREVGRRQHRRDALHARQRLHAALRLLGLAGLGLEAVDEALQLRHALLLAAVRGGLLRHALGAHLLERGVVAAVARERAVVEVDGDVGDRVEELAVVADHHDRAGEALQPGLEPDEGVQVQVVGGFVEQQQVGRAHQRAGQLQAHAPAAGEAVDGRVDLLGLEAQAHQQGLRARARVEAADLADLHVRVGHRVAVVGGLGGGELALRLHQRDVAFEHEVGGRVVGLGHVLRDLAQAPARGDLEVALRRPAGGRPAARTGWTCRRRCGRPGPPSRRG